MIYGSFETWVRKNSVIGEELSKTFSYERSLKTPDKGLGTFSVNIYAYDSEGDPDWARDESGDLSQNVRRVCTLKADLSGLQRFLTVKKSSGGQDFWVVSFKVNIFFGGTALKARLTWYEGVSISHFHHPQITDIWLCLSGNSARRSSQHYSDLSILVLSILGGWKLDPMNVFQTASVHQKWVMLATERQSYAGL